MKIIQISRLPDGNLSVNISDPCRKNEKSWFICDDDIVSNIIKLNL